MRVLRIINSLDMGGAERSIYENVPIHKLNGLDIDVLVLKDSENYFQTELIRSNINLYTLQCKSLYNPLIIFKMIPYFKKYDIIHAHLFPTLYWVGLAKLLSRCNGKLIFTEHATDNRRRRYLFWKFLDFLIYRIYDKLIAISYDAKENLLKHTKLSADKCLVIENGVNLQRVKDEGEMNISEFESFEELAKNHNVLLQIASFREAKDQDTLIRALSSLPEKFVVVFVGDGHRIRDCKILADSLNLQNRVYFLGNQQYVGYFIKRCYAIVVSSHWEGFGRAAVEGMALGKPVIGSDVEGLRDVIANKNLVFHKGNSEDLSEKIVALFKDPKLYVELARFCAKRSQCYDIRSMVAEHEELYETMLAKKRT